MKKLSIPQGISIKVQRLIKWVYVNLWLTFIFDICIYNIIYMIKSYLPSWYSY